MVCLVFIFLTPKSWFSNSERGAINAHQNRVQTKLLVAPEVIANESDTAKIEQHVRAVTGRNDVKVVGVRRLTATDGRTLGFEVDIQ